MHVKGDCCVYEVFDDQTIICMLIVLRLHKNSRVVTCYAATLGGDGILRFLILSVYTHLQR